MSPTAWIDDCIITAAQYMLKGQYKHIGGLQAPSLGQTFAMTPPFQEFVQIIHVCGNHWISISTVGCPEGTVNIFDSLGGRLSNHCKRLVADLMQCRKDHIILKYVNVQQQKGSSDCGLFSFITSICSGQDPSTKLYFQANMRIHLLQCIENNKIVEFPSSSRVPQESVKETLPIHCICRLTEDGRQMIECDKCKTWYHVDCINVEDRYITDSKLDWYCSFCEGMPLHYIAYI